MNLNFDVIVIGCGHAGCEAAYSCARLGVKTLLIGMNIDTIAWMPCNPSLGGPAKSHIVKEIDALGGIMGLAGDACYLQMKTLNASRGVAVHSLRAQIDKYKYSRWMRSEFQKLENLSLYQANVNKILVEKGHVIGIETTLEEKIYSKAVILTSGTFLEGKIYCGGISFDSGRSSEPASKGLSKCLQEIGFDIGRLKTGTPARINKNSVNFEGLDKHLGDDELKFFSFLPDRPIRPQIPCHAVRTTKETYDFIRKNLDKTALYGGFIKSIGPRYCPSLEDKIVKFPDKESHLLFLEPESLETNEIYVQGASTSLPVNLQRELLQTIKGLENVEIIRPAYAIEYDFLKPIQFRHTLESKILEGFYSAGQVLGTSGYEEAACQGLVAGANAALKILSKEEFILKRSESYIGTLIDDLLIKDIIEPYRMMTSRSEYRLYLRQENADRRLTPTGRKFGLVNDFRWKVFEEKMQRFENEIALLKGHKINTENSKISLYELLARTETNYEKIDQILERDRTGSLNVPRFEIETEIKYSGYVQRQREQIDKMADSYDKKIPENFDYNNILHLSKEAREKLNKIKPATLGQASKIDGVRQADITVLLLFL